MTTPNPYELAMSEPLQDATIAYILAWADPKYRQSHPRLHALGTELLRSLLCTQGVRLPLIQTLHIETQVVVKTKRDRIDILVQINTDKNANRIILIIEDKVSTTEHSNQIKRYKKAVREKYSGRYDHLVAVYLKTGNESREYLPSKNKCGHFLRRDLLDVLNGYQDTQNTMVDDFRTFLQRWEDNTNRWKSECYCKWQWEQWEGFYAALESIWRKKGGWCGWEYYSNPDGGSLACWLCGKQKGKYNRIGTPNRYAELFMQIHDAMRLTVRLGRGTAMNKVRAPVLYQVLDALVQVNRTISNDIRIEKVKKFGSGDAAAVANITFGDQDPWFAIDSKGIVDMETTIERLYRVQKLLRKVVKYLNEQGTVN